jgi:hypothetical protein
LQQGREKASAQAKSAQGWAIVSSPGFAGFAGQWPRAKRSLSADLIFWTLFYQEKSV